MNKLFVNTTTGRETILLNSKMLCRDIDHLQKILGSCFTLKLPHDDTGRFLSDGFINVIPKDGVSARALAFDFQFEGIDVEIPPEMPEEIPTFQEVFGI